MMNLVIGIAIGSAFAPFWMSLWEKAKTTALYEKIASVFTK